MNDAWRATRLKYVTDVNSVVLPENTDDDFEFVYIDIGNVTQGAMNSDGAPIRFADAPSRARRLANPGDTVVSTVRTYLRAVATVSSHSEPLVFSTGFAVLSPRDEVHPRFLSWYLQGDEFVSRIEANSTGVSYPAITATQLAALDLRLPPFEEQCAIAGYLDRETARIDTLIKEQGHLIEMLRERRWAVVERGVALLDWNTPFKTVATLIQTGPFGSQLKSAEYMDGGIPVINPSHIVAGEVVPDQRIAVSAEKAEQLARHKLQEGDLIVARRGDLGRCAVVGPSEAGSLCGTGSAVVRLDRARVDPSFAAIVFSSRRNRDALALASVGSTMENLNSDIIGALCFPIPPLDEQRALTADLEQATAKIDALIADTERFVELARERRAALITAAVTGQIDVQEMV